VALRFGRLQDDKTLWFAELPGEFQLHARVHRTPHSVVSYYTVDVCMQYDVGEVSSTDNTVTLNSIVDPRLQSADASEASKLIHIKKGVARSFHFVRITLFLDSQTTHNYRMSLTTLVQLTSHHWTF